jgi:molecular chaperone GrpE (heat shock protein)
VAESAFDVIDATSTAEERTQAVLDTKQAAERIGQLKSEVTELEKERVRYQAELDAYRRTVVARY